MDWQPNLSTIALAASGVVSVLAAVFVWRRRRTPGALPLVVLSVGAAEYSLLYAVATGYSDLTVRTLLAQAQYPGIVAVPCALFALALQRTGRDQWARFSRVALFAVLPLAMVLLVWTNELHHLVWVQTRVVSQPIGYASYAFEVTYGPAFWVYVAYACMLLGGSVVLLAAHMRSGSPLQRRQNLILLSGTLLPWIGSAIYVLVRPPPAVDPTPIAFSISGLLLAVGLFHYRLFDLVPVARARLVEVISDAIIVLDRQARLVDANPAAQQLAGQRRYMSLVGKPVDRVMPEYAALRNHLDPAVETRAQLTAGEGESQRYFDLTASPIRDEQGELVGHLVVLHDTTARHHTEALLLSQRHELATLQERERIGRELHDGLGQMMGYTNIQAQAARVQVEQGQIDQALATLRQLEHVAQDAHADVRGYILGLRSPTPSAAGGFLDALDQDFKRLAAVYGFQVHFERPPILPDSDPLFAGDTGDQLIGIVREALTNVRKHAGVQDARVELALHPEFVEVVISDKGQGFSPATRSQAAPTTEDAPIGPTAGQSSSQHFGLDIMRERAQTVGGRLAVHSTPRQGTRVVVRMPRRPAPSPVAAPTARPARGLRVLLADDHALFLDGLRNLLTAHGVHVVGLANDGIEAQDLARKLRPDIILMDIHMPKCDGLEATRRISSELSFIKIVMLTVAAEEELLFDALKSGASGYLLKNLESAAFLDLLDEVVRGEVALSPGLADKLLHAFDTPDGQIVAVKAAPETDDTPPTEAPTVLTDRQAEVLSLVTRGLTYKEIAARLYITERTVKYHMGEVLARLHLQNRRAAILYAQRMGFSNL